MDNSTDKYFATDDADKTIAYLESKAATWFTTYTTNNYLQKVRTSWDCYHGNYFEKDHDITFTGEQGELVNLPVNHYRNIARNILNMITSTRPVFQPRATNLDSKSEAQVTLASGLLEYYMREKKLERYLALACEYAVVLGSGYVKLSWNATAGEIYDYIDLDEPVDADGKKAEPYPVYEGDPHFINLSPFDVIFDTSKATYEEQNWGVFRCFKNKYDLAAKYPELRSKILELSTKSDSSARRYSMQAFDETTDVPIYEFMHKKTEACPNGRLLIYLTQDVVLADTVLPYRNIPVFRITPADFLGTSFGYTDMFDLIPIQKALNSLFGIVLSNQTAFGVQNVINPRGNDVQLMQVRGGLNFIEYNSQIGKPEALNLTSTPPEIFNFIPILESRMEAISGVSSVIRGTLPVEKFSGNALALLQSQSLQFMSGLQKSYIQLLEDVGTGLITMLQDFASVPRIAAIAGINNQTKIVEFTGYDLAGLERIVVDVGNPLSQSTAGRVSMAEQLIQMKMINSPEKYLEVINTGRLDALTSNEQAELLCIRTENERIMQGEPVEAVWTDRHSLHIREHRAVLADPKLRASDPDLIKRASAHMEQHINLLQTTDPNKLALIGEQPLAPPAGSPVAPGTMAPDQPPKGSMNGRVSGEMNPPNIGDMPSGTMPSLPNLPANAKAPALPIMSGV